jgi:putative hydrolase of the HAD superfamily
VTPAPKAVLVDFGGVLTTSVIDAFAAYSRSVSGDPALVLRLLRDDTEAAAALADHECGRLPQPAFEARIAERLGERGVAVPPSGMVAAVQAAMHPDPVMLDALAGLRSHGVPVALVTNSLGDDCYRGFDLTALADVVVVSSEVGVRKPSRQIYAIACERLGVAPEECVLIDDLLHNLAGAARLGIRGLHHVESARTMAGLAGLFGIPDL